MTDQKLSLSRLEEYCKAATPGPWRVVEDEHNHWGARRVDGPIVHVRGFTSATDFNEEQRRRVEGDSDFIANARTDFPALISWAKRVRDKFREYESCEDDDAIMMLRYAEFRRILLEEFGE